MPTFENWGDYFWPGQIDDCRINKLGIHDATKLETAERKRTAVRAAQLVSGDAEIPRTFDLEHLRAIHRQLFQDVYDWAGELRVTELVRPAQDPDAPANEFVKPEDIERLAPVIFSQLGDPSELRDRPTAEVVDTLARTYAAVNVLHPFVEGNGRTQRIFLDHAADAAGYRIDWSRIADRQNEVMAEAFGIGPEPVREALTECLERIPETQARQDTQTALHLTNNGLTTPGTPSPQATPTSTRPTPRPITQSRGPHELH
ncbi:Fic/DOC family protein [Kribbella sp. NPDC048928]|uniref:Fic/DOC family protein n=1 Tax=Kribbella sp. NPDC048928 TaxID=3364111 RepID=UPI00371C7EC5